MLFAIPIAYLSLSFKITESMGGYRVPLIKFSWWVLVIAITWALWILIVLAAKMLRRNLSAKQRFILFIVSHLSGLLLIASNYFHFYLFQEHWNVESIATAIVGVAGGEVPMDLPLIQIVIGTFGLCLVLSLILFLLKFRPSFGARFDDIAYKTGAIFLFSTLLTLTVIQHIIPANWHSTELQKEIPWLSFIRIEKKFEQAKFQLQDLKNIESEKQKIIQQLYNYKAPENLSAKYTPNILFIHVEALRSDMLNDVNMPKISALIRSSGKITVLDKHYSSSNNTGNSIFGSVHGLSGIFYQNFRENPYKPAPAMLLKKLGYDLELHSTDDNSYQQIRDLQFPQFEEIQYMDGSITVREQAMMKKFTRRMKAWTSTSDQPRFDYMAINSTHFNYSYPEAFAKFQPAMAPDISYAPNQRDKLERGKNMLFNRFKNSVLFIDSLLFNLFSTLEHSEYMNNTVIIVFGDHGQEFWEHNRFGHNYGFVDEQTRVVGMMYTPGDFKNMYTYTNNHDFMPTILSLMQLNIDTSSLMDGKALNLFDAKKDFSTTSMGAINKQKRYDEIVVGNGLKVQYRTKESLEIINVTTFDDHELETIPYAKVSELVRRAFSAKLSLLKGVSP